MDPVPIILLPGLLCDRVLWEAQIRHFDGRNRVIVPDLTAHDSINALAADVLNAAPSRFAVAGLSMGGYVALAIMRMAPERVVRLALLDTSARPDTPESRRRRRGLIAQSRIGTFKGVTPRLLRDLVHPRHQIGPVGEAVMAMAVRIGRDAFVRQQTAIIDRVDSRPFLGAITVPTMIVVGEQDKLTPPVIAAELRDGIPDARLMVVPDAGHLPPLEAPEVVNHALEAWLAG